MEEYVDNFMAENAVLHRKLESKAEALLILSQELEECRAERDQFKIMAEQVQNRYSVLKKKTDMISTCRISDLEISPSSSPIDLLMESREQNKTLRFEIHDLKEKLKEAFNDTKVLRTELNEAMKGNSGNETFPALRREDLVQQLETANTKSEELQNDLRILLEEKEELVVERDAYRCKVHRLNHQLNTVLKGETNKVIDIDALVMDNRYLQERLGQIQEEKELAHQALSKYKSMLDKKRSKGSVKLGNSAAGMVVSHKQVQELLEKGTSSQMPNTEATLADLKSLCLALLDALQDKSLALSHQRKANKILAGRISELEQRLESTQGVCIPAFPSGLLLQGYSSAHVDKDLERILIEDENSDLIVERKISQNSQSEQNLEFNRYVSGDDSSDKDLPSDLQELVHKALKDIEEEESLKNK